MRMLDIRQLLVVPGGQEGPDLASKSQILSHFELALADLVATGRVTFLSQCRQQEIYPAFSLVQLLQCCALIGRELQSVEIFSCTERSYCIISWLSSSPSLHSDPGGGRDVYCLHLSSHVLSTVLLTDRWQQISVS